MKTFFFLCLLCLAQVARAQSTIENSEEYLRENSLYLLLENQQIKYFGTEIDDRQALAKTQKFALKNRHINLHFAWINPLKYQLVWKDSSYIDPRELALNDFFTALSQQFLSGEGDFALELPLKLVNAAFLNADKGSKENPNKSTGFFDDKPNYLLKLYGVHSGFYPQFNGYRDLGLMQCYLSLVSYADLGLDDIELINPVLKELDSLDELQDPSFAKKIREPFLLLYRSEKHSEAQEALKKAEGSLEKLWADINKREQSSKRLGLRIEALGLQKDNSKDAWNLPRYFLQLSAKKFADDCQRSLELEKNACKKLQECLALFKASLQEAEPMQGANTGYFLRKHVQLAEATVVETELRIFLYEFDEGNLAFVKKKELAKHRIVFYKHQWLSISPSAGLHFANAQVKQYGLSLDSSARFLVLEETKRENQALAGLFFSFVLNPAGKKWAPLLQVGLDPSKQKPFFLGGIGFCLPSRQLAFTVGPLWRSQAQLRSLQAGQTVSSTLALEQDTEYRLSSSPQGFFVGIQWQPGK